jgi:hypothetical protein
MLPEAQKVSLELPWLPTEYCCPHDPILPPHKTLTSPPLSLAPYPPLLGNSSPVYPLEIKPVGGQIFAFTSTFPLSHRRRKIFPLFSCLEVTLPPLPSRSRGRITNHHRARPGPRARHVPAFTAGLARFAMADQAVILKCLEKLKLHEQVSCRAAIWLLHVVQRDAGFDVFLCPP